MIDITIRIDDKKIILDDDSKDTIIKALRLLLLVGNDRETMDATNLIDILIDLPSQKKHTL